MNKYRVRLVTGRVLGPFEVSDFIELINKAHLTGEEEYQEFPLGDWQQIDSFDELNEIFKNKSNINYDETFLVNLKELNDPVEEEDILPEETIIEPIVEETPVVDGPQEFKYDLNDPFEGVDYSDNSSDEEILDQIDDEDEYEVDNDINVEKTVIRTVNEVDDDKTKINLDYQKYLQEQKQLKEEEEARKKKEAEMKAFEEQIKIVEPEADYDNAKTEMLNIKDLRSKLEDALVVEEDFHKDEIKERRKKRKKKEKEQEAEEVTPNSSKKNIFVIVGVLIVLYVFLFPDTETKPQLKKITTIDPKFKFPVRERVISKNESMKHLKNAVMLLKNDSYINKLKASKQLVLSLEDDFSNELAAARLIFIYSELLKTSKDKNADIKKVYSLVQVKKRDSYSNPNFAMAVAHFYAVIGKSNAAINTLDRYLAVEGQNPTLQLFAVYLNVLAKRGDLVKASEIAKVLGKEKKKDFFIYKSLYEYYKNQSENEKQVALLKEVSSIKNYANSVYFLLEKAELFLKSNDLKEVSRLLFQINQLNAESSREYYAKYLKITGLYLAARGDFKNSLEAIKKSFKIYELPGFVNELANIETTDDTVINTLIKQSKVKIINGFIEDELKKNNVDEAFKLSFQAMEVLPNNIETRILLAKIQIAKGYFDDALEQLEKLYKDNKNELSIQYELIDIYLDTQKFRKAEEHLINIIDKTEWRYASARAKLYRMKNEFKLATNWLIKAINLNQLNEENIFIYAKYLMKFYKYSKAKTILGKAMDLDPLNLDYKITYAQILYEIETSASAIGYLYDILKDFPDNPKILSEIGIYYYKSGQIKNYEDIKEKLTKISEKDKTLYEFLLESAKLDDDFNKIIEYSKRVIEIDPGDLDTRIYLAEIYISLKKHRDAKDQLDEIKKRFSTYPRLKYFTAKLFLLIDNVDKAKTLAEEERKENPSVVDGPLLLAEIYKKEKDLLKAREYFLLATQIEPKNTEAIIGLGYVAFHTNQFDMAKDQLEKAIEIDKGSTKALKLLGDVFKKTGQSQPAVKYYKQYLELSPNSRYKGQIQDYIRKVQ